jgi:ABC-type transporter MlaC component
MDYHWGTLSQAQRDEFVQVFTGLLEATFIGKIEGYKARRLFTSNSRATAIWLKSTPTLCSRAAT